MIEQAQRRMNMKRRDFIKGILATGALVVINPSIAIIDDAMAEIYIDPGIAGDVGTGTFGDPYGDFEYAIQQTAFSGTRSTRFNVKSGTDEVLARPLDYILVDAEYKPTREAPLVIQGYDKEPGDGGSAGISGGDKFSIFGDAGLDNVIFTDLNLKNSGQSNVIELNDHCSLLNCEISNSKSNGVITHEGSFMSGCYIHDIEDVGVIIGHKSLMINNYITS